MARFYLENDSTIDFAHINAVAEHHPLYGFGTDGNVVRAGLFPLVAAGQPFRAEVYSAERLRN